MKSNGDLCFYGACRHYCKKEEPICSDQNMVEGALVLLMNQKLKLFINPWRRAYKKNEFATWERNMSFCDNVLGQVKNRRRTELLLDIVAVSIFDFLIGNADRHHLDFFKMAEVSSGHVRNIALLDNGKSFGDSEEDYFDILAPLYQCCIIRQELVSALTKFRKGLGKTLDSITVFDPLYPLLTPAHLAALDRRLNIVISTIKVCQERTKNQAKVIL